MRTVFKYEFSITDEVEIAMPLGAVVLHVGQQGIGQTRICLWAEVDTQQPDETRTFYVRGTGHPLPEADVAHVGSIVGNPFVWHVFEARGAYDIGDTL